MSLHEKIQQLILNGDRPYRTAYAIYDAMREHLCSSEDKRALP